MKWRTANRRRRYGHIRKAGPGNRVFYFWKYEKDMLSWLKRQRADYSNASIKP